MNIRNIAMPRAMPVEAVAVPFADCYITGEAQGDALIPPGGLPIYPPLTDDQVDAVCTAIADTVCRQFSRKGAE
jgi:hypothetical protein